LSNNVIKLDKYRKPKIYASDIEGEFPDLENPIMIGWVTDENGDRCLHIVSSVSTVSCLWMIDLAREIVESRPEDNVNDNE
jgi:hypothetical protein|tara:strand:+ start:682 stop:924 length:243 start_codon:yes stop_codon:yes gene_type:complete